MSDNKTGVSNRNKNLPEPEMFESFIELQKQEIALKTQEVALRGKELDTKKSELAHNQEIAKESIKAQLEDSKLKQAYFLSANLQKNLLIALVVIGVFAFLFYAMTSANTEFAEKVFNILIGAIGGFAAGKVKKSSDNTDKDDE